MQKAAAAANSIEPVSALDPVCFTNNKKSGSLHQACFVSKIVLYFGLMKLNKGAVSYELRVGSYKLYASRYTLHAKAQLYNLSTRQPVNFSTILTPYKDLIGT